MIKRKDLGHDIKTLIEFCLPFSELKHIVDGMAVEGAELRLIYPCEDNFLRVQIPEDVRALDNSKL